MSVLTLSCLAAATGCSMKTRYDGGIGGAPEVEPTASFSVGAMTDNSGFKFDEGDENAFSLTDALAEALSKALLEKAALASDEPGQFPSTPSSSSTLPETPSIAGSCPDWAPPS